ncbi:MAG TPA: cytochrome c [Terriglobales bacterium]|nr:cytochrome c [Terriglobales bacterium]
MIKGLILGILVGLLLVVAWVYLYFSNGKAPVAVTSPEMPFERKLAQMAQRTYLDRLPHPEPATPADERNFLEGATIYKENCAVCHGLPGKEKTAIAEGMFPHPPQLFRGVGVTDDEPWESYWRVENGIRMTGMPGFKERLTETQIWQVSVLVKNADKIPDSVKNSLTGELPPKVSAPPISLPAPQ